MKSMCENLMKLCLRIVLLSASLTFAWGQEMRYGLKFHSYEVEKEKRTGLNLSLDKAFVFPGGFTLSFDINFCSEPVHPFGSVFRILSGDRQHIDFMLSEIENTGETMVSFISSSEGIVFKQAFGDEMDYDRFIPVQIHVDISRGLLSASVGSKKFSRQMASLESFGKSHILFGKSNHPHFQTTDVPSFILKNIKIGDAEGRPLYEWLLSRHAAEGVYDELKGRFAPCENPEWILDSHVFWQKRIDFEAKVNPQFCYNPDKNEVAVFDEDALICFDLDSGLLVRKEVSNKLTYTASASNNFIYNPYTRTYNCYVFHFLTGVDVLVYDTLSGDWNRANESIVPPDYWHHNRFFSPTDSSLYLMNGYGHHTYKNTVNRYDYHTKTWESLSLRGDRIHPRYLGGLGRKDEGRLILFGGYGSESGKQEMQSQSYYDMYEIDVRTLEARKVWEMESPALDFAVSNSLVYSAGRQAFYALTFPLHRFHSKLVLLEVSMNRPEYRPVGDSIPFSFEDTRSNVDLYHNPSSGHLIAVVVTPESPTSSRVAVYTLSDPPLAPAGLYQAVGEERGWPLLLMAFLALSCSGLLLWGIHKHRARPGNAPREKATPPEDCPEQGPAIYLLGGFRAFDKQGMNITKEFSPMLRQLFVLLLLYTTKNGTGISSAKLKDTLWYDKSEKNAKNNRGVCINKLRQLFGQIGPVQIRNNDLYWSIALDESIYCDYLEALRLIAKLSCKKKDVSTEEVKALLSMAGKGELLPNLQIEWVDSFKSDLSNSLIDLLLDIYKQSGIRQSSPQVCISLADVIFIHDSLNEEALRIKCRQLSLMGKYGLAQKVYTVFVKEYKMLLNTDFKYTFEQVIRGD
jgi:hypothetical protein